MSCCECCRDGKCPAPTRTNVLLAALFDLVLSSFFGGAAIFFLSVPNMYTNNENSYSWWNYLIIVLMLLEFIVYGPLSVVLLYGVITSNPKFIQSWMAWGIWKYSVNGYRNILLGLPPDYQEQEDEEVGGESAELVQ